MILRLNHSFILYTVLYDFVSFLYLQGILQTLSVPHSKSDKQSFSFGSWHDIPTRKVLVWWGDACYRSKLSFSDWYTFKFTKHFIVTLRAKWTNDIFESSTRPTNFGLQGSHNLKISCFLPLLSTIYQAVAEALIITFKSFGTFILFTFTTWTAGYVSIQEETLINFKDNKKLLKKVYQVFCRYHFDKSGH